MKAFKLILVSLIISTTNLSAQGTFLTKYRLIGSAPQWEFGLYIKEETILDSLYYTSYTSLIEGDVESDHFLMWRLTDRIDLGIGPYYNTRDNNVGVKAGATINLW